MNILFTICGRAGSKGIKNKNIRNFLGKPLVYYTISIIDLFLKKSDLQFQYNIVVNSDSKELISLCLKNRMQKLQIIERNKKLGGDAVAKINVISDCLIKMETLNQCRYDIIIDLDITSPLRRVIDLKNVIDKHINANPDVTTTVVQARRNPYFNQLVRREKGYRKVIPSNYTARQQAPEILDMNASIYAYNRDFLLSGKGVLDGYCECVMMLDTGILDLDHENDIELMEIIAQYLFNKRHDFAEVYNNIINE